MSVVRPGLGAAVVRDGVGLRQGDLLDVVHHRSAAAQRAFAVVAGDSHDRWLRVKHVHLQFQALGLLGHRGNGGCRGKSESDLAERRRHFVVLLFCLKKFQTKVSF